MNKETSHFTLKWFITSALGVMLGGMAAIGLFWGVGSLVEREMGQALGYAVGGALMGASFAMGGSLGPALLLERWGVPAARWLLGSVLAATLGMALCMALVLTFLEVDGMPQAATGLIMGLALGFSLGVGQWFVLRASGVQAGAWPLLSAVAYVAGISAGLPLGGEGREWLALGVTGLLAAAITAPAIGWLLRRPQNVAV